MLKYRKFQTTIEKKVLNFYIFTKIIFKLQKNTFFKKIYTVVGPDFKDFLRSNFGNQKKRFSTEKPIKQYFLHFKAFSMVLQQNRHNFRVFFEKFHFFTKFYKIFTKKPLFYIFFYFTDLAVLFYKKKLGYFTEIQLGCVKSGVQFASVMGVLENYVSLLCQKTFFLSFFALFAFLSFFSFDVKTEKHYTVVIKKNFKK